MILTLDSALDRTVLPNGDTNEDTRMIRECLEGDNAAFSRLVTKYRRQVYGLAYRYTRNREEADDLAQETFIKAFEKLNTFRGEASFKSWLLRITTNLSINNQKSSRVSKDVGKEPDDNRSGTSGGALDNIQIDERNKELRAAIHKLPPKQRTTLVLKTLQEMTCQEVATTMGCSVGTVKANVFNALKKLKSIMGAAT